MAVEKLTVGRYTRTIFFATILPKKEDANDAFGACGGVLRSSSLPLVFAQDHGIE